MIYFHLGDCFSGKIANNYSRQIQLIELFVSATNDEFTELQIITKTRVPIVRFLHKPTNFKCDLNFRSGIAVLNSELVKYEQFKRKMNIPTKSKTYNKNKHCICLLLFI